VLPTNRTRPPFLVTEIANDPRCDCRAGEQIVGHARREREVIADFQLPIVDLIRAAASTVPFGNFRF
jgi:hypothetical protein